jgi:hypothetical protein
MDATLFPPFSLTGAASATGVKQFNLAFIDSGGGCTPEWGGDTPFPLGLMAECLGARRTGDVRAGGTDGVHPRAGRHLSANWRLHRTGLPLRG